MSGAMIPPAVIAILGDSSGFSATVAKVKVQLADLAKTTTQTKLGLDTAPFQARLVTTIAEMNRYKEQTWHLNLDDSGALAKMAMLQTELQAIGGVVLGGGGGGIGADLAKLTGGGGGGSAAAGGIWTWIHAMHLFTPEIVGFATALASVAIGFGVLGIASIGAAADIGKGFAAVSNAQNAIAAAIPGTTQWTRGIQSLGNAWSTIPAVLQPAVASINKMMQGFGNTSLAKELQGFLGAQAGIIGGMVSGGAGAFAPLILATQRAMDTVEGIIKHAMGSGALTSGIATLSKMVGPATIELVQMAGAIAHIAAGFAKAVQDGQGMEMIVNLFRSIGQIVNSSLFQGFIAGWVDFDRVISVILGLGAKLIAFLSSTGTDMHGLGEILGFVVSGLVAVKSALFLLGKMGVGTAQSLTAFSTTMTGVLMKTAGVGLLAAGITGLVGNVTSLIHLSNPLTTVWNAVGNAFGFVSKKAGQSINTINGYRLQLTGAIPITGQMSDAMDLLVRSEQSVGSSLGGLVQGFRPLTLTALGVGQAISTVTDSVTSLINTLVHKNSSLATWAADAQILIRRGMDPSAVASLAQQAPQDLASMVTGTTAQLRQMNVQWQEQMLLATMSGQKGIAGFITSLQTGIQTGTPTVKAAAMALATSLGSTLNLPFNGSVASVKAIGKALNALPASVLATLAGKTHQYSAAVTDATTKTKAATTSVGGLLNKLVSVGTNLLMVGVGFKLLGVSVDLAKVAMVGLETVGILAVAAGLYELIHHFGVLHGLMIGGAVAVGALTVAFIALDAVPVVALIAAIGLAIVGLVAGIVDLVTHFGTVKHAILAVFDGANMWLNNIGNLIMQGLFSGLMAGWHDVTSFFGGIGSWIKSHKGPPSADAVLLVKNGQLIMQGLGKGLLQGFRGNVQPLVAGMAGQIRTGMGGALPGVGMGGRGGMGGSSQTNYFHNEVTVQGGGGNPQQVGQAVDKVMTAHTATVLRALRAGSGSNY